MKQTVAHSPLLRFSFYLSQKREGRRGTVLSARRAVPIAFLPRPRAGEGRDEGAKRANWRVLSFGRCDGVVATRSDSRECAQCPIWAAAATIFLARPALSLTIASLCFGGLV